MSRPKVRTRLSQLHVLAATWRAHRRRISLAAIVDTQGIPRDSPEESADLLADHWGPIFAAKAIEAEAALAIMQFTQAVPEGLCWSTDRVGFHELMAKPRDSAPGPDGIPFSAWRAAGIELYDVMFDAFDAFINGETLPPTFNTCNLAFIPKGEDPNDDILVARAPSSTRPISLSNTDNKYFALAINRPLAEVAKIIVHPRQRGFVQGKSLIDNVLEVEGFAQSYTIAEAENPAIFLFDVMAAFPSLSHQWLFVVLAKMKIPKVIIRALKAMYADCSATIVLGGRRLRSFNMLSGIRQGCPASGTLFALAIDPCLRFLIGKVGPKRGIVNAYADDIAAVLRDMFASIGLIDTIFQTIGGATSLHLHPGKVQIIPLWKFDAETIRAQIRLLAPRLAKAKVQDCGKLLGVFVGPGAETAQWKSTIEEIKVRSRYLASLNMAWSGVAPLYRSHVASVTSHILQFVAPSKELLRVESSSLAVITKTPANALPIQILSRLREFGLNTNFSSLAVSGAAAAYRALMTSGVYQDMMNEIARARASRDSNLSPYLRWWTSAGILGYLTRNKKNFEFIACTLPFENFGLQKWASQILYSSTPLADLDSSMAKRLSTFLRVETSQASAATARTRMAAAKDHVPQCAMSSALRTISNAWTTTGRFSGTTAVCPFGCGAPAADRFSHFPSCLSLREMWQEVCPSAAPFFRNLSLDQVTLTAPPYEPGGDLDGDPVVGCRWAMPQ